MVTGIFLLAWRLPSPKLTTPVLAGILKLGKTLAGVASIQEGRGDESSDANYFSLATSSWHPGLRAGPGRRFSLHLKMLPFVLHTLHKLLEALLTADAG